MACDDLITNQDLENAKKDATTMSDFVESNDQSIVSKNGKTIRTLQGINDDAQDAIDSFKLKSKGQYLPDPITLNDGFEYVVYLDKTYFAVSPPYTTDPVTYPTPDLDTVNLIEQSYLTRSLGEKIAGDGDSQLAGGNIWPLSSQESAEVGDIVNPTTTILRNHSTNTLYLISPSQLSTNYEITALDFDNRTATIGGEVKTLSPIDRVVSNVEDAKIGYPVGSLIRTLGYYAPDDGGSATYRVTDSFAYTADEYGDHTDASGNVLELLPDANIVNGRMYGITILDDETIDYGANLQAFLSALDERWIGITAYIFGEFGSSIPLIFKQNNAPTFYNHNEIHFDCRIFALSEFPIMITFETSYRDSFFGTLKLIGYVDGSVSNWSDRKTDYGAQFNGLSGSNFNVHIEARFMKFYGVLFNSINPTFGNYKVYVPRIQSVQCGAMFGEGVIEANVSSYTDVGDTTELVVDVGMPDSGIGTRDIKAITVSDPGSEASVAFYIVKGYDPGTNTLSVFPKMRSIHRVGLITYCLGGGAINAGADGAQIEIGSMNSIRSAFAFQDGTLYGTCINILSQQFGAVSATMGGLGFKISSLYSEATAADILTFSNFSGNPYGVSRTNLIIDSTQEFNLKRCRYLGQTNASDEATSITAPMPLLTVANKRNDLVQPNGDYNLNASTRNLQLGDRKVFNKASAAGSINLSIPTGDFVLKNPVMAGIRPWCEAVVILPVDTPQNVILTNSSDTTINGVSGNFALSVTGGFVEFVMYYDAQANNYILKVLSGTVA